MRIDADLLSVYLDSDLFNAGWSGHKDHFPGQEAKQFAMTHLRKSFLGKYEDEPAEDADSRALELFIESNKRCEAFDLDHSALSELESLAIGEAKDFLYRFFYLDLYGDVAKPHRLNMIDITNNWRHGPGASIGCLESDFYTKVGTSNLSATSQALFDFYEQAIRHDPLWAEVEFVRSIFRGKRIVPGSRLSFAPKKTEISRTICTEPPVNMMFQLGIGSLIESGLKEVCGIDLQIQPEYNRRLARYGSITGKVATIDLKSASDLNSIKWVKSMLPRQAYAWLDMCRSPVTKLPCGDTIELHMVSSMGNGFTFPLQTLLFYSLVYGAYRALGIKPIRSSKHNLGNIAVFGDDIICVKEAYDLVCRLLSLCGHIVNVDKSFNDGFFRESCGRDFLRGRDVRGVYIKHLRDVCDRYSAINRLNVWTAKHCIYLPQTVGYLLKGERLMPIPLDEAEHSGVKVFASHISKVKRDRETGGIKYRYLFLRVKTVDLSDIWERPPYSKRGKPHLRGFFANYPAVMLSALAGTLWAGKVVAKNFRRSTRVKVASSSSWNWIPPGHGLSHDSGQKWKLAIELNLNLQ